MVKMHQAQLSLCYNASLCPSTELNYSKISPLFLPQPPVLHLEHCFEAPVVCRRVCQLIRRLQNGPFYFPLISAFVSRPSHHLSRPEISRLNVPSQGYFCREKDLFLLWWKRLRTVQYLMLEMAPALAPCLEKCYKMTTRLNLSIYCLL